MSVVALPSAAGSGDDGLLKQRVHRRLVAQGVDDPAADAEALRAVLGDLLRDEQPLLPAPRYDALLEQLTHEVTGLGPLEPLLADPTVTEVMVNGPGRAYVERAGRLEPVSLELDAAAIVHLVERVVTPLGLRLDRSSPMVDARLTDGSRLHAVIPPLAVDGPCVTIRRFGTRAVRLDEFGVDGASATFLRWTVAAGWNLLVAGATSAGKTTLLNALSQSIPHAERVVTIEETAELRLAQPHVVRLEARPPNAEGAGGVDRAGAGADRAAHASRPPGRRRGARRRGPRHAAGPQHRPRRFDVHHPRQRSRRRARPLGDPGAARGFGSPPRRGAHAGGGEHRRGGVRRSRSRW